MVAPAIAAAIIGAVTSAAQQAQSTNEQNRTAAMSDAEKHRYSGGKGAGFSGGGKVADISGSIGSLVKSIMEEKFGDKDDKKDETKGTEDIQAVVDTRKAGYTDTYEPTQNKNISNEMLGGSGNAPIINAEG